MLTRLKKFQALDGEKKRLLLQAYRLLGTMRFAILTTSFKRLVAGLNVHREPVELAPLEAGLLDMAHRVGWAVRTAARFTPWASTCLVQVLAAQRMLAQRGIAGAFYLGATTAAGGVSSRRLQPMPGSSVTRNSSPGSPGTKDLPWCPLSTGAAGMVDQ